MDYSVTCGLYTLSETFGMVSLTHRVEVAKGLMHADDLVVQLIITVGVGQECVAICDEQVEHVDNLKSACGHLNFLAFSPVLSFLPVLSCVN